MADFQDYFTNPQYIGGFNAIREHDRSASDMGVVYVEDGSDTGFWQTFIDEHYPQKYITRLASRNGKSSTGKRFLETLYPNLNSQALVAVDADYDYIKAHFDNDHPFNTNPYILHTFAFNRESVLVESDSLHKFFVKCRYTVNHQVDLKTFLDGFSQLAYEGLIKFTTALKMQNYQPYIESEFHKCFHLTDETTLVSKNDITLNIKLLDTVENRLSSFFSNQEFSDGDLIKIKHKLTKLKINENNAYRFICGHTLEDLVKKIHELMLKELLSREFVEIRNNFKGEEIKFRIKQFENNFKPKFVIDTFFTNYPINHDDEIHQLILQRVQGVANN